jgi:serine/threonine protein kinase
MPEDARPAGGSPAPAEHELLTRLGKYVIERKLGSGGMGTVFLAKDSDLKRTVALKVLSKDKAENPVLVRRFKAEGQAAAYLQHKNIVGVYDSGQIDGFLYIALEFVDGQDVLDIIRKRGVIPVKRSIEIIKQVTEALQHAYEKQIVHRDIKPSNLLIKNDGTVKLADLGLARSIDETLDTSITRVGTTVGTVDYMSPEQARNSKATDIRSDIYSLGCTWYHMLTGVPPYGEGSVTNKLQAHATAPLPDPRSRNERIPEGVVAVLHRMMAKQSKDRYQTPSEILEDLNNPGITRSGLNADVLAALAQPGTRPAESSSGDIFESRVPLDSVELDNSVRTLRQDALPTGVVFDEETYDDGPGDDDQESSRPARSKSRIKPGADAEKPRGKAPPREEREEDHRGDSSGMKPRIKPGPEKETPRGKAPPREERVEEEERRPSSKRSGKTKGNSGDPGTSGPLPRRQSETERETQASVTDSAKHRFKQRKLPPRSADTPLQSEPVRMSLDPDRIRAIVLGGIVLVVLAGLGFALSRMVGTGSETGTGSGNVAAGLQQRQPEQQPAVVQQAPSAPPGEQAPQQPVVPGEPNDASTPLRKAAEPIVGAEDLTDLNSKAAREFVPSWLFQVRKPIVADAKTTVVRRPGTPGDGLPTFAEALAKLPTGGPAVIEFHGDGPFVIPPGKLPSRPQIVLKAANGSRPVLVFNPSDLKPGEACLKAEGAVVLRGLNLVLATVADSPSEVAMIEGGALSIRDCTLQSVGPGAKGTCLVRIDGAARDSSGAVLENCHLRSTDGDGLRLLNATARVVAGNSLFCFAKGNAFAVAPASDSGAAHQGREITLLRSTVVCGKTGASLAHEGDEKPAPTAFTLRKSSWNAATPEATLLLLKGWPVSEEALTDKPIATGTSWKSEQASLEGWDTFARIFAPKSGKETQFEGDGGWQKFWRQSHEGTRFADKAPDVPADFASQDAAALVSLGASRDIEPGCKVAGLPKAPVELIERVRVLASSRRLPGDFIAFRKPTAPVEFDIKPGALNAFLNDSSKCPEGALVQLKGAGLKTLPAIVIQNRTLHIEFVQSDKAPLTIRPQPNLEASALITVQGGSVSISNGRFLLPESDRQTFPTAIIEAAGANIALTNCTLTGPIGESSRLGPLIRWTAGEGTQGMLIRDSFLTGGRNSIEADVTGRMLEIDNSILAATGDSLSLSLSNAARPADIAVTSSTLGGGRSMLSIASLPSGEAKVLTVILNDTVVVGTASASKKASMLTVPAREDLSRITWWEDGVGYAAGASPAIQLQNGNVEPGSWSETWGAGHVLRLCATELAVLFEKPLEALSKADLAMFRLNPGSLAATWSSSGGPLGAIGTDLGAPSENRTAPAPDSGTQKTPAAPPKRPRSVF